jgi:aminoglycoside 3-N-acetyltransferase
MKASNSILSELNINKGDLIYVHSSFSRLKEFGTACEIIDELMRQVGNTGTIVFPSFCWNVDPASRPWKGYDTYFYSDIEFDVLNTKSNIGYLSEYFRTIEGVLRSTHPFWAVCAIGRLAKNITSNQEHVLYPYSSESSFGIMQNNNVKIIGLGVTLNTTSLCPIVDYDLGEKHTQHVFSYHPLRTNVIDSNGKKFSVDTYTLLPSIVRNIKPSRVFDLSENLRKNLIFIDREGSFFFSYRFKDYYDAAMNLAHEATKANGKMPWLENIPLRNECRDA